MNVKIDKNARTSYITGLKNFNLYDALSSGQTFRYEMLDDKEVLVMSKNNVTEMSQDEKSLIIKSSDKDVIDYWINFFDLDTDYEDIIKILSGRDGRLKDIIEKTRGVRILKQDVWEMIICFILSANNNIPRIKSTVKKMSIKYGEKIFTYKENQYYSFPTPEALNEASISDLRSLGMGFRDKYIKDAASRIVSGELDLERLYTLDTKKAKEELMKVKGIGNKVADCILLFGLGKPDVFPVDVWIERIMNDKFAKYNGKDKLVLSKKDIESYASDLFGDYMGYAQQYMFYYCITFYKDELKDK